LEITRFEIKGLALLTPQLIKDERGYFYESYRKDFFDTHFGDTNFIQDNQSTSQKGTLRGLHFQAPPFAQGKLVRVLQGAVIDIAIDIRKDSLTYGKYQKVMLSAENHLQFWIPPGFAHGFLTLMENTIFCYKCTNIYNKLSEGGLCYNDKKINIDWEIQKPIISEKDLLYPDFNNFLSPF